MFTIVEFSDVNNEFNVTNDQKLNISFNMFQFIDFCNLLQAINRFSLIC